MRKLLKLMTGTALFLVWGFAVIQTAVPGGFSRAAYSVAAMLKGTSPQANQTLEDRRIPLADASENGFAQHGRLRVQEGQLVDEAGAPIQLRGMSSHGIAWFPQYTGAESIAATKGYGANLFRVAMYVDDTPGNYTKDAKDQAHNVALMTAAIDNALSLDMYAIADWHILEDGNPLSRADCAVAFFDALSAKYANAPGVIYEICNEPNGDVTWDDIAEYAGMVIPTIRRNAPDALILVGTPQYSTDLMAAIRNPLPYENIMYSYHYYSNAQEEVFRGMLGHAIEQNLPVFVTEWGVGSGDALSAQDEHRATSFLAFLQEHGISWANWSLCNKDESYAAIPPSNFALDGWAVDDLSTSGQLVFTAFRQ